MTRGAAVTVILLLVPLFVAAVAAPVHAQVRVEIGIQLPAPTALVVIPGAPVYYAPRAPANVFFYAHQYWVFANGGWYVGPTWNGPWAVVEPVYVPPPMLQVPVRYYPVPPPEWRDGVMGRRSGSHTTDVSGAKKRTSATGVNASSPGVGTRGKVALQDSRGKDVVDAGPAMTSPGGRRRRTSREDPRLERIEGRRPPNHEVRAGYQDEDRESARADDSPVGPGAGHRDYQLVGVRGLCPKRHC